MNFTKYFKVEDADAQIGAAVLAMAINLASAAVAVTVKVAINSAKNKKQDSSES